MLRYVQMVRQLDPGWNGGGLATSTSAPNETTKRAASKSGLVVFSQPILLESEEEDNRKDIWHYVSAGDLEQVAALLDTAKFSIDQPDEDGRTPLMWAVDKEHIAMATNLLKRGAAVNGRDSEGQTALHYAALQESKEMVQLLLEHGADKTVADNDGSVPSELADNEELQALLQK